MKRTRGKGLNLPAVTMPGTACQDGGNFISRQTENAVQGTQEKENDMRTFIIIFFQFISLHCFCQVSIENDCLEQNSITVGRIMLDVFGSETVQSMLDDDVRMLFVLQVDSLGYVSEIKKIRTHSATDRRMIRRLKRYFRENRIQMRICYSIEPGGGAREKGLQMAGEDFRNSGRKYIAVGFPGDLVGLYEYYKVHGYKGVFFNSRMEYFWLRLKSK